MKHLILILFFIPLFVFAQSVDKQWIEKGTKQVTEMTLLKEQGLRLIETSAMITKGVESGSITTDEASVLINQSEEASTATAIAQQKTYNYVFVLTVENVTSEEGANLNDDIYKLQEKYKNKFKIDFYQKNDFDKRMIIPDLKSRLK